MGECGDTNFAPPPSPSPTTSPWRGIHEYLDFILILSCTVCPRHRFGRAKKIAAELHYRRTTTTTKKQNKKRFRASSGGGGGDSKGLKTTTFMLTFIRAIMTRKGLWSGTRGFRRTSSWSIIRCRSTHKGSRTLYVRSLDTREWGGHEDKEKQG